MVAHFQLLGFALRPHLRPHLHPGSYFCRFPAGLAKPVVSPNAAILSDVDLHPPSFSFRALLKFPSRNPPHTTHLTPPPYVTRPTRSFSSCAQRPLLPSFPLLPSLNPSFRLKLSLKLRFLHYPSTTPARLPVLHTLLAPHTSPHLPRLPHIHHCTPRQRCSHAYTHAHACTHTHMYVHAHTHTCTRKYLHIYAHTCTYTHIMLPLVITLALI